MTNSALSHTPKIRFECPFEDRSIWDAYWSRPGTFKLQLLKKAEQLQQIEVNYDVASTFVGDAYLKNLLSPHMMSSFLESIATNKDFAMLENRSQDIQELKGTAWQLYNNATEALKRSVPSEYVERHADLSNWFVEEMGLEPSLVL